MAEGSVHQVRDLLHCIPPGWRPAAGGLHDALRALDPGYDVAQLKEKFGGLRCYIRKCDGGYQPLIRAAEAACAVTCQDCGQPGHLRRIGRLHAVLCEACAQAAATGRRRWREEGEGDD